MSASATTLTHTGHVHEPTDALPPIPEEGRACDVCPHAIGDHDATGLRFCRATRSAGTERGCVCR